MVHTVQTVDRIWRTRQLLPCWIVQGICISILGVMSCLTLGAATIVLTSGRGTEGFEWLGLPVDDVARVAVAVGTVLLTFCITTLLLDAIEAFLFRRGRLSPRLLLVLACAKTVMWLMYFFFVVATAARGAPSPLDLILGIILVTTSVSQVILGGVYYHKERTGRLARGDYADLQAEAGESGGKTENQASIPRSKTWRASIPAITVNSREWSRRGSEETDYQSYRNSLIEAELRRQSGAGIVVQELPAAAMVDGSLAVETQTLTSSVYDAASPPQSPDFATGLSHPPIQRMYSPASSSYNLDGSIRRARSTAQNTYKSLPSVQETEVRSPTGNVYSFDQADLALTGFYGKGCEGETRRF